MMIRGWCTECETLTRVRAVAVRRMVVRMPIGVCSSCLPAGAASDPNPPPEGQLGPDPHARASTGQDKDRPVQP